MLKHVIPLYLYIIQILRQFKDLKHVDAGSANDADHDGAKNQQLLARGGDDEDQHMMLMDDSHLDDE